MPLFYTSYLLMCRGRGEIWYHFLMITVLATKGWKDYRLLDSGEGMRLEQFGKYRIAKPDPQAIWKQSLERAMWEKADATFYQEGKKDRWVRQPQLPSKWILSYHDLSFYARLTPFKHTGIFPEQSLNWDFIQKHLQKRKEKAPSYQPHVLNLFAYTGIASLVAAKAGAKVTHVDASKPSVAWARENQEASNLSDKPIRWILDDAVKFLQREVRRGVRYDGIIMDPPVYGHGPSGERWDFTKDFPRLVSLCQQVLSQNPLFLVVNAYAISASSLMLENVLADYLRGFSGTLSSGELLLEEQGSGRFLSTGIYARWSSV